MCHNLNYNGNKFVLTHELIQLAMYLVTLVLRIEEIFFSIQHIKKESICRRATERGGGVMEHGMGVGCRVLHFRYQVSTALF